MKLKQRIALHDYALKGRYLFLKPSLGIRVRRAIRRFLFDRY